MTLIQILESREEALDVHQVAELLKVSERHIYELAANGSLPAFRVGKVIRFDPQDVADWLRRKKPTDKQHNPRNLEKRENPKANRDGHASIVPAHVWRNKADSLEAVLAMDNSSSGSAEKLK